MIDDTIFNLENILTILIGIVIVASIYITIDRRGKAKRRRLSEKLSFLKNKKQKSSK